MVTCPEFCSLVTSYVTDFTKETNKSMMRPTPKKWESPPEDMYKINIDGAFKSATSKGGWGFLVRNSVGAFLEGGYGNLCRVATSFQAEALAALYSLERAALLGMIRIILETDATELVRGLTSEDLDHSIDGILLKQIRDLIESDFVYCEIQHCPRNYNKVADCLAMYGASVVSSGSLVFMSQAPTFISELVSSDLAGDEV